MRTFLCLLGFHRLRRNAALYRGQMWAFCDHCSARYVGEYDPMYGTTHWRRK